MVFLYECLSDNVTPKSFRLRAPMKTTKCENIMKKVRRKLVSHAQNEAKRSLHESKKRLLRKYLFNTLSSFVSRRLQQHYASY